MIILYTKIGCPFCHHVLASVDSLGDRLEERNVANQIYLQELMERGGKLQVPFLVDQERKMSQCMSPLILLLILRKNMVLAIIMMNQAMARLVCVPFR